MVLLSLFEMTRSASRFYCRVLQILAIVSVLSACSAANEQQSHDVVTLPEIGDEVSVVQRVSRNPLDKEPAKVILPSDIEFDLWWRFVGSEELEALIDRAVVNSQTLQISAQRVIQAKAQSIQIAAGRLPSVTANTGYSITAPNGGVGTTARGSTPAAGSGSYSVGLDAAYTVDLWRQKENLSNGADLRLKQAIYQYDAELLNLITVLSKRYLEYLSLNDRIANAKESEQALSSMLSAMETLYEQGDATVVEMQMQRSSVYSSKILLPSLLLQQKQLEHQIARLIGLAPGELKLSHKSLSSVHFPADVQNISSSYILRRPDVRAIESAMLAADADVDAARASLLPSLTLSSGVGFGSANFDELFQPHTLMWNFIASLTATVFDGGKKEQQLKYTQSVRAELVESYVFTLYSGLQQAKDALANLEYSEDKLEIQRLSTDASKVAHEFGFESYRVGGIDFLTFLDSAHSYQKRKDELFIFDLEYYQAFIDFYAALGGGITYRGIEAQAETGIAQVEAPSSSEPVEPASELTQVAYQQDGWFDDAQRIETNQWLVRFSGVYDQFAVESMLRDLPRRYPSLSPVKEIVAEKIGFDLAEKDQGASWFALSAIGFSSKQEADDWCRMLRNTQQRCVPYQADSSFEIQGKFALKAADGIRSLDQLYAETTRIAAHRQQALIVKENRTQKKYGRLYSLLGTQNGDAWLIGNNSYRVWRVSANDRLHYSGYVKSVDDHFAVVSFEGQDFILNPIYYLEAIENSLSGRVAKVRWGGATGKVFFYSIGDKVYGNGVIENIGKEAVVINWKGYRISLALNQKSGN